MADFLSPLRLSAIGLAAGLALAPVPALAGDLCNNGNIYAVYNRPAAASTPCRLARPARVHTVMTYHWNGGRGVAGGTITLRQRATGKVFGPFRVKTTPETGNIRNVYWTATLDMVLPAGDYDVFDSDVATWSWNQGSGNNGIVVMVGDFVTGAAPAPPVSTSPPVAKPPPPVVKQPVRVVAAHPKGMQRRKMRARSFFR